ncbi:hypothetical protein [Aquisalimonas sp.]|uniref:hypothetical protein n=1 Tax=unclassified Aquisalimonas TaxID=2644645 RepID=UPI0025BB5A70|nr:hypothetical protein [Aquisalimonas sp.]
MHRQGLQIGLMIAVLGAGSAGAGGLVPTHAYQQQPLNLDLRLSADDWLLQGQPGTEQRAAAVYYGASGSTNGLAAKSSRAGSGFRVGPIVPALCEDDLPGTSAVVDAYSRAMECDDDQIGLSVSIRNY